MLRAAANYLTTLPTVFIDGLLYMLVAMFAFMQTQLGTDDAAKYISPTILFWLKFFVGTLASSTLAIKLYRSTAFAEHQQSKKNDTTFFVKQQQQPIEPKV